MNTNVLGSSGIDEHVKAFHRKFVTGVPVVTVAYDGKPYGLVVNSFASVSVSPPTILVCVSGTSSTHDILSRAQRFAVNLLASNQLALAKKFATKSTDKFTGYNWEYGDFGSPIISGTYLEAEITSRIQMSTHTVFFGHVLSAHHTHDTPLVYTEARFFDGSTLQPVAS